MLYKEPFYFNSLRPYRRREDAISPTPRAADHTGVNPAFERQESATLQKGNEAAHHRPRIYTDREPRVIGDGSHTGSLRQLTEGKDREESVNTRVNVWIDSLEFFPVFPVRALSPLARDCSPNEQSISIPSNVQVHQRPIRISCAIKVDGCEMIGNPFVANSAAFALFSANPRPDDSPCLRLGFDSMQVLRQPFDELVFPRSIRGSVFAHSLINALDLGPFFQHFKPPTVRWYAEHVKHLDYRRAVEPPGDRNGDAEVIQLCPGDTLRECLIRMTWVSTSPYLWGYNEATEVMFVPHIRANLWALKDKHQSKEITIWFLNPWDHDATHLHELVQSLSRRRST